MKTYKTHYINILIFNQPDKKIYSFYLKVIKYQQQKINQVFMFVVKIKTLRFWIYYV